MHPRQIVWLARRDVLQDRSYDCVQLGRRPRPADLGDLPSPARGIESRDPIADPVETFTAASNEFLGGGKEKAEYHPVVA